MSYIPLYKVAYSDGANLDAFSRLRVSNNNMLFSSHLSVNDQSLFWSLSSSASPATASYQHNSASMRLFAGNAVGGTCVRQTRQRFVYRAGNSHKIIMTWAHGQSETGVRKRWGYFDDGDGIFLETSGGVNYICLRSSVTGDVVDQRVPQSAWNVDVFDGSGSSGTNLDVSKANILTIDMQWLGAGRVRVGFTHNGEFKYAHEFNNENTSGSVYMRSATLPVRYETTNVISASGDAYLDQICSSVVREGGQQKEGFLTQAEAFNDGHQASVGVAKNLVSVRLSGSIKNAQVFPVNAVVHNRGTATVRYRVIYSASFAQPLNFSGSTSSHNITEPSTDPAVYTEGIGFVLATGFIDSSNNSKGSSEAFLGSVVGLGRDLFGNADAVSLVIDSQSGNQNVDGSIQYLEFY